MNTSQIRLSAALLCATLVACGSGAPTTGTTARPAADPLPPLARVTGSVSASERVRIRAKKNSFHAEMNANTAATSDGRTAPCIGASAIIGVTAAPSPMAAISA